MRHRKVAALLIAAALAGGCATEVRREAVQLAAAAEAGKVYELRQEVQIKLDSGFARTIRANTEFAAAGRISQGLVLRPTQTVLTVEGAHVHEAYAVVRDQQLVGFYLPVERAYSALSQAAPFPIVERK